MQARLESDIKQAFSAEYGRADVATGKSILAEKLLRAGLEPGGDADRRYVLLREAREMAGQAGKFKTVWDAVEGTVERFEVDELNLKLEALETVAETAGGVDSRAVADKALSLVDDALGRDQHEKARRLLAVADKTARKGKADALIARVEARSRDVDADQKEFQRVEQFRRRLKDNPNDAEANLVVGKHDAFHKGDWETGLPALARGSDAVLRTLAAKEQNDPDAPQAQAEIADAWWDLAQKEKGPSRLHLLQHAQHWYEEANLEASGLLAGHVQRRLQMLEGLLPRRDTAPAAQPAPKDPQPPRPLPRKQRKARR